MEFNKSNRFNEESQVNQTLIHYKGILGEFDYDPSLWGIVDNYLVFKDRDITSLPENLELPKGCIDTSCMFSTCTNLTDISPLQNWNISNVKHIWGMFKHCEKLTDISPLYNWDTSQVKDMSLMFA